MQDFVARIEGLWQNKEGLKCFEARWYYFPEDTKVGRLRRHHKKEVFESTHSDDNELDTIQRKCVVLGWDAYRDWAAQPVPADSAAVAEEVDSTFVCRAQYNVTTHEVRPLSLSAEALTEAAIAEIPLLSDPTHVQGGAAPQDQAPLSTGRRTHSPYEQARTLLNLSAVPRSLPCRDKERAAVIRWMRAAIAEGGAANPLYVSGVPGTGKTAIVHEVR